jgi:hypothetical protein
MEDDFSWTADASAFLSSVRQHELRLGDALQQVCGNNFQDIGEGNDGIERCRIMPIFNLRNVGAAVSCACGEFLLRETPLQAKRLYPISEQPAGNLWQDVVDFSCCTSNCLFSILIMWIFKRMGHCHPSMLT